MVTVNPDRLKAPRTSPILHLNDLSQADGSRITYVIVSNVQILELRSIYFEGFRYQFHSFRPYLVPRQI